MSAPRASDRLLLWAFISAALLPHRSPRFLMVAQDRFLRRSAMGEARRLLLSSTGIARSSSRSSGGGSSSKAAVVAADSTAAGTAAEEDGQNVDEEELA